MLQIFSLSTCVVLDKKIYLYKKLFLKMQEVNEIIFPEIEVPADFGKQESLVGDDQDMDETVFEKQQDNMFEQEEQVVEEEKETSEVKEEPEVKEEQEEQTDSENDEKEEASPNIDDGTLKAHVEALKEMGYLILPDDYEVTAENLEEAYQISEQNRNNYMLQQLINEMPDKLRDVVLYGLNGGDDLNKIVELEQSKLDLSVETEEDQMKVMRTYLKSKGNDDYYIDAIIDRLQDTGKLEEEASKRLEEYNYTIESQKQEEIAALEKQKQEQLQAQQAFHSEVVNHLKQQRWEPNTKKELYDMLYSEDKQFENILRQIYSNPTHLVEMARILRDQYDPQKGFNISERKQQETTLKKSLVESIASSLKDKGRKSSATDQSKNSIDWSKVEIPL